MISFREMWKTVRCFHLLRYHTDFLFLCGSCEFQALLKSTVLLLLEWKDQCQERMARVLGGMWTCLLRAALLS